MRLHPTEEYDILQVESLRKVFRSGASDLVLFDNMSFRVRRGEMLGIVGQSGAGKSTLLHILGALDKPNSGEVRCAGQDLRQLTAETAADFRNREIGYVWQFHYLLPEFTALENVAMPLLLRGMRRAQAEAEALGWLREVELENRQHHRSGELSGGEQQRVTLARALVTRPKLLLADEPTGDLDNRTAEAVFALIGRLHREYQLSSIIVTHNPGFARRCDRVLKFVAGQLQEVEPQALPEG